jgi:hypothetical protein
MQNIVGLMVVIIPFLLYMLSFILNSKTKYAEGFEPKTICKKKL